MKREHYFWIAIGVLALVVLLLIAPAWRGNKILNALEESGVGDEYVNDMAGLQTAKNDAEAKAAAAEEERARAEEQLSTASIDAVEAAEQLTSCQEQAEADAKLCNDLADSLAQEKADVENELDDAEGALEEAANQLCCVQQIFDPDISGYEIKNEVECVTSGGNALECQY